MSLVVVLSLVEVSCLEIVQIVVPICLVFLYVLQAMGRAATSLSKLADTARQELPSIMAAIRLSGMEISDLTLELNDLR